VSFYDNLYSEMIGPERDEMLKVIDHDERLDEFLERLDAERKMEMAKSNSANSKRAMSKEEYLAKHTIS
jgi:ribosome assembly protein YihI (activator of Der GTPase)